MKRLTWAILFSLICATCAMAAPRKVFLNDGDAGTVVTLDPRTVAVIELWSNPSTGFGWRARQPLGKGIRIVGSEFESSQPGMLGTWGMVKVSWNLPPLSKVNRTLSMALFRQACRYCRTRPDRPFEAPTT